MDLLSPAENRVWACFLGLHSKLSGLGVSVCRGVVPWAHLSEALLMLLPDSLLRTQNTLPLGPIVHKQAFLIPALLNI